MRFESGRGLPHSKTLSRFFQRNKSPKVLECGSPLPLFNNAAKRRYGVVCFLLPEICGREKLWNMNTDAQLEITGRLAALELLAAKGLALGLAPHRHRADLVEEWKQQFHAKLERLPAEVRAHAVSCADRVLYAGLAAAEDWTK